jgi:hypothetical protein
MIGLSSCIGSAHYEVLIGSYSLGAMDVMEDMTLDYKNDQGYVISIITATVFAVGYDKDFIVVKQHPREFPNPSNKSITNYFIVPLKDKISKSAEKNIIGPLTKDEFSRKCKEIGVTETLEFTKVFKDLE